MARKLLSSLSLFVVLVLLLVLAPASPACSPWTCSDLITPEKVGHEEFERYGIAEKLENDQFLRREAGGYILCSHGTPRFENAPPQMYSDIYYLFEASSGELVVTRLKWDEAFRERQSAPQPTPQPADVMPGSTADSVKICIDADTPVEIGSEPSEQRSVSDILGSNECKVVIEGKFCWDCGAGGEMTCLDANTALELSGERLERDGGADLLANKECTLVLGGGELCWVCREAPPAPTPARQGVEALPPEPERAEPLCRDFLTADAVGRQDFEHYGIAEKLRGGQFKQKVIPDSIICWADRTIGEAEVYGDELYYRFDLGTGDLLMMRTHWREDLPQQMPTPLITRQEAEVMVEGEVQRSYLKVMSPDEREFGIWFGDDADPRRVRRSKSTFEHPTWFVWSREVHGTQGHELDTVWITLIDAMTGQVLGRTCPC